MTEISPLLSMVDRSVGIYGTAPTAYLSALAAAPRNRFLSPLSA